MMDYNGGSDDGRSGMDQSHKVYLAVDHFIASMQVCRWDGTPKRYYYHYNKAFVKLTLGHGDRTNYPMVYEALQAVKKTKGSDPILTVVFNAPNPNWIQPPTNGNVNDGTVRITLDARELLQRLLYVCGAEVRISLQGYLFRNTFRKGQPCHLNIRNRDIVLAINPDGTTTEETISMPSGLLGQFELSAKYTVALEWRGPMPLLNGAGPVSGTLRWSEPNLEIVSSDDKTFHCHSEVIYALSPVFDTMMKTKMLERAENKWEIKDFDSIAIRNFLKYAYEGSIKEAFTDSTVCFKLFSFSHKYDIKELESATRALFLGKTLGWFRLETALELYCFLGNSDEELLEKACTILECCSEKVPFLPVYRKFTKKFPQLQLDFPAQ